MIIATFAFLFFLVIFTNCFAQENLQDTIVDIKKVTFLSPGISYEKKVGKFESILGQPFMNTSFSKNRIDKSHYIENKR